MSFVKLVFTNLKKKKEYKNVCGQQKYVLNNDASKVY